ncbi:MBOAT family protein [bacterium]|nr:MBOAT family protein [bacterium]
MLFNSTDFLVFFGVFLLAWYVVRDRLAARNGLIVVASYIFYAWWDYRFTALLLFSSVVDYLVALAMDRFRARRSLLLVSLVTNLGVLFFFKYFDFFRESTRLLLAQFGVDVQWTGLQFVLPVGISFYTFQTLSYTIDVYRGQIPATRNLMQFMAYVSFFPQLVAGPIERAAHLLPQMARKLTITLSMVESGVWLFIWGMFKKVVLADGFSHIVDPVFRIIEPEASQTLIATTAFAFQIYCDFSGYTDMARGLARILGFDLMVNFNLPYFATSVQDFWRRWHISLSTWLRDYLYLPLGGNRIAAGRTYLNLMIVMLLGGLWHGAAWNFLAWGLWQAIGLIVNRFWSENIVGKRVPASRGESGQESRLSDHGSRFAMPGWLAWLLTMMFTLYGWLLFRANSAEQVLTLTASLANWNPPVWAGVMFRELCVLSVPLLAMQIWQCRTGDLEAAMRLPRWARGLLQAALIYSIILFWQREAPAFIYFQF